MLPLFLDIDRVLRTHRSLIERYGGCGRGPRRRVAALRAGDAAGVLRRRVPSQGSVRDGGGVPVYHIVQNHPFLDGNKRTGAATAIIFLAMNQVELEADEDGLVALTLAVAEGQAGKQQIADFFRSKNASDRRL